MKALFKNIDKFWIVAFAILLLVSSYFVIKNRYESKMLKHTSTVLGTIGHKGAGSAKDGPYAIFNYSVRNEHYELRVWGDFMDSSELKYYCIEYSIENPSVARLKKFFYCKD